MDLIKRLRAMLSQEGTEAPTGPQPAPPPPDAPARGSKAPEAPRITPAFKSRRTQSPEVRNIFTEDGQ